MKYNIINNFLEKKEFSNLKNMVVDSYFPWFLGKGINKSNDLHYQFVHTFYVDNRINSNFFEHLLPVNKKLKIRSLIRIKANLIPKNNKIIEHGYHCDFNYADSKTAILYINNNNGYTKFKDGFVSSSEENKIVIFNANERHTGTTCTDSDYRIVININYF
jgi:hypothetical protein